MRLGWTLGALAAAVAVASLPASPILAQDAAGPPTCNAPAELVRLDHALTRTAVQLNRSAPLRIVAIGSSSTSGSGASSSAMSYPSRLETDLKEMFPQSAITVLNRGVGGEAAREMVARFDTSVFAERPDLVLWQVGSNSVLYGNPVAPAVDFLRGGLKRLRAAGVDVVVINPQYAPKVIAKPDIDRMVDMIDATAREASVNLFQRFAVMRYWRLTEDIPFSISLSKDELHLNDWSYGCLARLLAGAIGEAATRPAASPTVTAKVKPRS